MGNCNWYLNCLEKKIPCGTSGYAMGYGYFFCNRFIKYGYLLDQQGLKWRDHVMICLQKVLLPYLQSNHSLPTCNQIKEIAFHSHEGCYTTMNGYTSICNLSFHDWISIIKITYLSIFMDEFLMYAEQVIDVIGKYIFFYFFIFFLFRKM